ncbi:hypothetical protein [Pseudomonas sp. O230]|uniref:hypothetical protein n=1 Tax=Pseudomonas sp. O230 TaxID=3159450 RepID=UPI00387A931C
MSARWEKLGLLYCPGLKGRHPKLLTHAANPLPLHISGNVYRIFYCGRDYENRSSVGAVDIDIVRREVVEEHYAPFFVHGPSGSFHADGVSIGNCYERLGRTYMTFMGWQSPAQGHWRGDIGRVEIRDLTIVPESEQLLMGMDHEDPISLAYPWVAPRAQGGFDMWYPSVVSWEVGNGEMLAVLKHATSTDGEKWSRHGAVVPYALGVAQAFSRPSVIQSDDGLHMWFSYRAGTGQSYRIGHAVSAVNGQWELALKGLSIDVSDTGWDSEMVEYPFVFRHNDLIYMLYNGNGYGKTGFGLAVLRE